MANIAKAIEPKSDQQNAVDYLSGPRVFTVTGTSDYMDEKRRVRVSIHLAEAPDRPFKPSATNLRLIVIGWGQDDTTWVGRRIKLDLDPNVTFGGEKVGGIRVVALSNLEQRFTAKLPTTRGKKAEFRVEKLGDAPPQQSPEDAARRSAYTRLVSAFDKAGIPKEQRSREAVDFASSEWDKTIKSPADLSVDEVEELAAHFEKMTAPAADAATGEVLDWEAAEVPS